MFVFGSNSCLSFAVTIVCCLQSADSVEEEEEDPTPEPQAVKSEPVSRLTLLQCHNLKSLYHRVV